MTLFRYLRARPSLTWLLAALLGLYVVEIHHGLPNRDVVWAYDANPLIPLIAAKKIFLDGWNTGWHSPYPNFHYYVLLLFLTPYMGVQWLLGNLAGLKMDAGYPYGLKDFDTIFMHIAIITRLVSITMALGTAYWIYRIGEVLGSRKTGFFAACIVGFSPATVYYVHTETLDVPMLFWLSIAMYCYVRAMQTFEPRYYYGLAICAAVSTATKDYAYGAFVLIPFPLVVALARQQFGGVTFESLFRAALDKRHIYALVVFVGAFAIAENWVWNFTGFVNHVKLAGGFDSAGHVITTSFGRFDFFSPLRIANGFRLMTLVLGWAGLAVCLVGLLFAVLRDRRTFGILVWPLTGLYLFSVCQVLPAMTLIERPYMSMGILLAVFGGLLLGRICESTALTARVFLAAAVGAVAINGAAVGVALVTDPRYQAEHYLREHVAHGEAVELYGKRSELPRLEGSWKGVVINPDPRPFSDVELTVQVLLPESLAERGPDWIVVSEAFLRAYRNDTGTLEDRVYHAFLRRLGSGELGFVQAARFVSPVPNAFGLPDRYAPRVTVFTRKP